MFPGIRTLLGVPRQQPVLSEQELEIGLEKFCHVPNYRKGDIRISESHVQRIQVILKYLDLKHGRDKQESHWHLRPRTYSILRNIGCLDTMDLFIKYQLNDFHLPYNEQTLPTFIKRFENNDFRRAFLDIQSYFLFDFKGLEIECSKHKHFTFQTSGDAHFASRRILGQGGFGAVDLVVSRLSLKRYARKRVVRGRDSDSNRRAQASIIEELKQLKWLNHRHLVKIIGSYTDKEYIAYLMSPVAHGTLEQFLTMTGFLHPGQREMLRQFYGCLAGAVHYLHNNCIRHRDLTARNILIYDNGVYISDFGSAYSWAHQPTSKTQHMDTPVSPDYMAPEVGRGEEVGSSSDMWSLGVVFLEMTTRLLGRRIEELRRRISSHARKTKAVPYIYANYPVVTSWLEVLRLGNTISEHDNEPLFWTQDLLRMMPGDRPSSRILMKEIRDSSFVTIFSCFKCHEDFQDGGFAYESPIFNLGQWEDMIDMTNTTTELFQDGISVQSLVTPSNYRKKQVGEESDDAIESPEARDYQQDQCLDITGEHDSYSDVASEDCLFYDSYGYDNSWIDVSKHPQLSFGGEDIPASSIYESSRVSTDLGWHQDPKLPNWNPEECQTIPRPVDQKDLRDTGLGFLEYDSGSSVCRPFDEISEYSGSVFDEDEYQSVYSTARPSPEITPRDGNLNIHEGVSGYFKAPPELRLDDEPSDRSELGDGLGITNATHVEHVKSRAQRYAPVQSNLSHDGRGISSEHQILPVRFCKTAGIGGATVDSSGMESNVDISLVDVPATPPKSIAAGLEEHTTSVESEQKPRPTTADELHAQNKFEKIASNHTSEGGYALSLNATTLANKPEPTRRTANLPKPILPSSPIEKMHCLLRRYYFQGKSKAVRLLFQHECNPKTIYFP
ncbi:kinase-like domain-containing protein [Annulohypoxylon truncatum]|uniref:kinase-like domain-containing protein n=1 Tax=Annulohypoxylon truncatum TaxID=327061 RepID=UPI0020078C12|nr:kinase-like domain-containing protein [Annulohypoxylon truncatum]KAI1214107.1 kinase-like domain-containing protein [Annulohypoxylon truncatum]